MSLQPNLLEPLKAALVPGNVAVFGEPHSGQIVLVSQLVYELLTEGHRGVYEAADKEFGSIISTAQNYGWKLNAFKQDQLVFVNSVSEEADVSKIQDGAVFVKSGCSVKEYEHRVHELMEKLGPGDVDVVDSLNGLASNLQGGSHCLVGMVNRFRELATRKRILVLRIIYDVGPNRELFQEIATVHHDRVISTKGVETNLLEINIQDGEHHIGSERFTFKLTRQGLVYSPQLLPVGSIEKGQIRKPTEAERRAYESYVWVCTYHPYLAPPEGSRCRWTREMYECAKEHVYVDDEGKRIKIPSYESWKRQIRAYEYKTKDPKNRPRRGREHGKSIVDNDEI